MGSGSAPEKTTLSRETKVPNTRDPIIAIQKARNRRGEMGKKRKPFFA